MPKVATTMGPLDVRRLTTPGLHAVGEVAGLGLLVKPTGAKSWVLRTMVAGKRCHIGLGGYPTTTLAQARERARAALDEIHDGQNPLAERLARKAKAPWTFKATAAAYITAHAPDWKNKKHAGQWTATLEKYAYPHFGEKHVADVDKQDVLAAVGPIWRTKHETATRVLNRVGLVLSYATQRGLRPDTPNPARWQGNLDLTLPRVNVQVQGHAALPIDDMHAFVKRLRQAEGMGARALEFTILTAARSGEVRGATWGEIDMDAAIWTIPATRMKAGREHRVPLSDKALELLEALPRFVVEEGKPDLLFPGMGGKPLSDMSLTAVLRRMDVPVTAHGFRSTFRDWCGERTATPPEVAEMALAHSIGDKTVAAYFRSDLFDKRRTLMQQWATFIDTAPTTGTVRAIRGARSAA